MPEGDTVYKVAAFLAPSLENRDVLIRLPRVPAPAERRGRVVAVRALGKHLLVQLEEGAVLRTHLGMYGSWHRYPAAARWRKPRRQARVVIETDQDVYVCFNAKEAEWLVAGAIAHTDLGNRIGPDLLGESLDLDVVLARAAAFVPPEAPLADLLLDQRVACGVGNVYKSEVLFLKGLSPVLPWGQVPPPELAGLYALARRLLGANLGGGPRITRRETAGGPRLWVYGRQGLPCLRCGDSVRQAPLGRHLRSSYFCGRCQDVHDVLPGEHAALAAAGGRRGCG
jgi:endonuclease-8